MEHVTLNIIIRFLLFIPDAHQNGLNLTVFFAISGWRTECMKDKNLNTDFMTTIFCWPQNDQRSVMLHLQCMNINWQWPIFPQITLSTGNHVNTTVPTVFHGKALLEDVLLNYELNFIYCNASSLLLILLLTNMSSHDLFFKPRNETNSA